MRVKSILKDCENVFTNLPEEIELPIGVCHGDLTFSNILFASNKFYFYNLNLAGDITGECRELTKTMWKNLEEFFHETIWKRKDLWEQFDFALDESKHDWFRQQVVSCYSDTDSVYTTYETFFNCFTEEYQKKYDTVEKQIEWILKFNQEFLDKQNTKWCEEIYNPRHGKNVHEFELETVSQSQIILKKKKYLKGLRFNKGKFLDKPKMSGTGIEIIKSTTPKLCREILTDLTKSLMFDFDEKHRDEYIMFFNDKLREYRKIFQDEEKVMKKYLIDNFLYLDCHTP